MSVYTITIIVFFTFLATNCSNSHEDHTQEAVSIELNNGQKWKVNTEMTPYILEAEQVLMQFNSNDYKKLAEQLEAKNKGLIKSCTMDGKSHDELHKWLHPHIQLIKALDDPESKEEADKVVDELKSSFQTYHKYFQ